MKKRKLIYFLLALLCVSLQSCLFQEEDYFDDSSANRASASVTQCRDLLKSAPNGWILEYYPGTNYSMGGITLLCKFDEKGVSIISEVGSQELPPGAEITSLYQVISEQSTLLTFDSFNELIHCYSEPILKQNNNFKGDYEFVFMNTSENQITLQGKKYQNTMIMTRLSTEISRKDYIASLNKITNEAFLNDYILKAGGQKYGEVKRFSRILSISTATEQVEASFIYTPEGFKFQEPISIGGKMIQHFKWEKTTMSFSCTDSGAEHVILESKYPTGYKQYEDYLGFYYFYYKTLSRDAAGNYVFVDAVPFIAQVKQKQDKESYTISGADLDVDIVAIYDKAIGKIVIKPQHTTDPSKSGNYYGEIIIGNNKTSWLPAHLGASFGYIASFVDSDYGLVAKTLPNDASGKLYFSEYGSYFSSLVGSPATSIVITIYNSAKPSSDSFVGYWNWIDSIILEPYK